MHVLELSSCFGPRSGRGDAECEPIMPSTIHKPSSFTICTMNPDATRGFERSVTSDYHVEIDDVTYLVSLTWCKGYGGIGLSLHVKDRMALSEVITTGFKRGATPTSSLSMDMKPWSKLSRESNTVMKSWSFGRKKGSKRIAFGPCCFVDAIWDLSNATYSSSSPEPLGDFFFVLSHNHESVLLLLGDMRVGMMFDKVPFSMRTMLVTRIEHIIGQRIYSTRVKFRDTGHAHDILIECNVGAQEPALSIRVDKHIVAHVERLVWKFRGNQTILVDGLPVELFWDVHNWFFSPSDVGHAIFMFQTTKPWSTLATRSTSFFRWQHTTGTSTDSVDFNIMSGFSLLLYVWKF